jgi:hypothetical protein
MAFLPAISLQPFAFGIGALAVLVAMLATYRIVRSARAIEKGQMMQLARRVNDGVSPDQQASSQTDD